MGSIDDNLLLSAKNVKNWYSLKKGDWFVLEYSILPSSDLDMYSNQKEKQIEYKVSVLNKTKNELSLSIKPIHVYVNIEPSLKKELKGTFFYFDSYYLTDFLEMDEIRQLQIGQLDSMKITIDDKTGLLIDSTSYIAQEKWHFLARFLYELNHLHSIPSFDYFFFNPYTTSIVRSKLVIIYAALAPNNKSSLKIC